MLGMVNMPSKPTYKGYKKMYFFVNEENLIIGKSDTQFLLNQVEFDNAFGLQFDFFDVELEVEDLSLIHI